MSAGVRGSAIIAATVKGILGAKKILKEFRPAVVIGVGGYASFPMLGAAILNGYPRIIMEQNAVPGLANRVLGRWVDFAAVTDPGTSSYFGKRAVVTGNPDSAAVQIDSGQGASGRLIRFLFSEEARERSPSTKQSGKACRSSSDWKGQLRFIHQTGEAQLDETRAAYAAAGFDADVRAFFNEFHQKYAAADLIVSRAGATTVAEIKASGRAAVLIPFPFAADDHQTRNAQSMVGEGAAIMISNADLTGEKLAETIRGLLSDIPRLEDDRTEREADCGSGCGAEDRGSGGEGSRAEG